MSGLDLIVSTRIHGCMAGILSGTLSFVIPTDFQIQELVNVMQILNVSMEKLRGNHTDLGTVLEHMDVEFEAFERNQIGKILNTPAFSTMLG